MEDGEWEWEWEWGESKCKASESNARYRRGFKLVYLCFMCAPAAASRWRFTAAALPSNYLHARILFFGASRPGIPPGYWCFIRLSGVTHACKNRGESCCSFFCFCWFWLAFPGSKEQRNNWHFPCPRSSFSAFPLSLFLFKLILLNV